MRTDNFLEVTTKIMQKFYATIALLAFVLTPTFAFSTPTSGTLDDLTDPYCFDDTHYYTSDTNVNKLLFWYHSGSYNNGIAVSASPTGSFDFSMGDGFLDPLPLTVTDVWFSEDAGSTWYHSGITFELIEGTCEEEEGGGEMGSTTPIDWGSATTTNRMLGSLNFGLTILIVLAIISLCGYIWNALGGKKKKPWQ